MSEWLFDLYELTNQSSFNKQPEWFIYFELELIYRSVNVQIISVAAEIE